MKKRVMAMLMCIFMTVSFLPSAAFAAENQTQTAAQLSANAVKAIAEKTAAAENFNKEMETFRGNMEANLKTTGNSKLDGLKNNMDLIQESWEKVSAEAGSDYTYDMSTNTLTVSTAAGLAWMAQQVNSGSLAGTAVTLAADIDLTGKLWTPAKDFTGTFDGQNHTIKGLAINNEAFEDKLVYLGLFQNIKGNKDVHSFVKNVTFENISVYAPMFTVDLSKNLPGFGAAAGYSDYTDYENITVTGEVVLYAMGGAAGIVYDSAYDSSRGSSIKNCAVKDAAVYASEDFYGMTYNACNAPVIQNCTVSGSFYVKDEFAGIAYYACYGALIKDCSVSGSIYSDNDFYGITYEIESNEYEDGDGNGQNIISGCSVDVNVCSGDDLFGLAYSVEDDSIISECNISGTFYSGYYFFGLAEALKDGGAVEKCTISGKAYGCKGGAAGFEYVYGSDDDENERKPASIFNIEANLTASYPEGQAGGLIIETDGNVNISDCTVAGEIYSFSDDAFGGIVSESASDYYSAKEYRTGSHRNGIGGCYCDTSDHEQNSSSYHSGKFYVLKKTYFGDVNISNCSVTASLWRGGISDSGNGGIIGEASSSGLTIAGCSFTGGMYMATTCSHYTGGLVGEASSCDGTIKITDSDVSCDILCAAEEIYDVSVGGLIGGDSSWSAEKLELKNCNFNGNIVVKATGENETDINRIGAIAACVGAENVVVTNCSAESQIVLDGSIDGGSVYHGGAMFGGLKYPKFASIANSTFTGDVTMLGSAENEFCIDHFGMVVGEDCAVTFQLQNITVNGDFYSDYAGVDLWGGVVGHRCDDNNMTASNVIVNTDVTMLHSGEIDDFGGFVGDSGDGSMKASECQFNGNITVDMTDSTNGIGEISGFLGDIPNNDFTISKCSHTGNITVKNAEVYSLGGFAAGLSAHEKGMITDSYTFGDISLENCTLVSGYGIGQWVGNAQMSNLSMKNCYSVGDLTVKGNTPDDSYIGNVCGNAKYDISLDNYYHAGTLAVDGTGGTPSVGYLTGNAAIDCTLTNVYYDKECFAASTLNGAFIGLAVGDNSSVYETTFVPLATAQMQENRYETSSDYKQLDGAPAVAEPDWDYLNGKTYADEIEKKAALVDALNAGKDGYLNWRVDGTSFRGYPFFGKTYTILYYVDFGSGYELQNIEQFDKTGVTAKEIPVPDQTIYPNGAYEWQDQNGVAFTESTILNGDKIVYAKLVNYYNVQYITNYPDNLENTPSDNDILESGYMSGASVTIRSNNTFTIPDGYRFKEWNTAADGSGKKADAFSAQKIEDENLIFYAIWEPLQSPTYSVYYVANGGSGDMWDKKAYSSGETATVKANKFSHPEGLTFEGFLEYETGKLYQPDETLAISRDTYLIAQWKASEPTFSVTYLSGGGKGNMTDENTYKSGENAAIKENIFTYEGYQFTGFVDLDNNHYDGKGEENISMTKDVILIAQWTPSKYNVTYHGNGAEEQDVVDSGYLYNTSAIVRDGAFTFTKKKNTFQYWSLTPDGEKAYDAYDSVTMNQDIELYAVWKKNTSGSGSGSDGSGSGSGKDDSSSSTYGILNITNTDSADKKSYLSGAEFEIYTNSGELIGTYTTDKNGNITIPDLSDGKYYAIQITPSKGYKLDSSKHEFAISGGKTTAVNVTNERTKVPDMLNGDDHFAYIIGRNDGLVHPEASITRAEVTTIFFRLLDPTVRDENLSHANTFSDIKKDSWFNTAISTMTKLGIVNGRTSEEFDPNASITRAEFAAIAARFDKSSAAQTAKFSDISGHWAAKEISKAAANGWVNGYADGTFKPDKNITRAEAMALINRVINRTPENADDLLSDMVEWPDNMDVNKWYYLDVQEATNSHDFSRKTNACETWKKLTSVPDWTIYEK